MLGTTGITEGNKAGLVGVVREVCKQLNRNTESSILLNHLHSKYIMST